MLGICLVLANSVGLDVREFISNFHVDIESLLKVLIIIGLMVVKYLLKLLVSLVRVQKLATAVTIMRSAIDYITTILMVVWSLRILGADINGSANILRKAFRQAFEGVDPSFLQKMKTVSFYDLHPCRPKKRECSGRKVIRLNG